ncbi:MAG TPA: cell division regulator GpsB [Tenericutes bacterium]|nr:cell division regulator GpsB [Mycoplasmatota bacterium]
MYQDNANFTSKDILEKDFKVDTRGYRPQEVDRFLDLIALDYNFFRSNINRLENEKQELIDENIMIKQEVRKLKQKLEILRESSNGEITNADLLRRISNLEKIIFGKE